MHWELALLAQEKNAIHFFFRAFFRETLYRFTYTRRSRVSASLKAREITSGRDAPRNPMGLLLKILTVHIEIFIRKAYSSTQINGIKSK